MTTYIPVRVRLKNQLRLLLPKSLFAFINKVWINTFAKFFNVQNVVAKYTAEFVSKYPKVVQGGPFKGMQYVDQSVGSNYVHKLIGSYESILHPYIESLRSKHFDTIIDIGAAEGYYLVGLGQMFPDSKLVGFEIEENGRQLIKEMYEKNSLKNKLVLEGEANVNNVVPYITEKTLLICDCEGGELDILNPITEKDFSKVDTAIIELHDFIRPGIKEALTSRFSETHNIKLIPFAMANPDFFPFLASITNENEQYELRRERGWQEQEWMILEKKAIS